MQVEENIVTNFQKDFKNLHIENKDDVMKTKYEDAIEKIAKAEGYIKYTTKVQKIDADGGNFLGVLYTVDIQGITKEGKKETNIFVKQSLSDCKLSIVDVKDVYNREIYVYNELSKIYDQLQEKANIPQKERLKMVKCYSSVDGQTLFLENMKIKGYAVPNRSEVISIEYAESAIKDLAKLHGLSFALQETNPNYFDEKLKPLNFSLDYNDEWNNFALDSLKQACSILENAEDQNRLENVADRIKSYYFKHLIEDRNEARALCHGDYRSNNILEMKNCPGETRTIPIDYQCIYFGNPMADFHYFLMAATDRAFRQQHLHNLKELYYCTLSSFLKYFHLNIQDVYPRETFEKDYVTWKEYGLMMATILLPFLCGPEDEFPDFQETDLSNVKWVLTDQYKERMVGVFEDLVEWGII